MFDLFLNVVLFGAAIVIVGWFAWPYLSKLPLLSSFTSSSTGKQVASAVDISEFVAAYQALTLIRLMPNVQNSKDGLAACDTLRNLITSWESSTPATVTTVTTTTTLPAAALAIAATAAPSTTVK